MKRCKWETPTCVAVPKDGLDSEQVLPAPWRVVGGAEGLAVPRRPDGGRRGQDQARVVGGELHQQLAHKHRALEI